MIRWVQSIALAAGMAAVLCVAPAIRGASASSIDDLGRWKLDGSGGCYWDENDDGPNQCDPNDPDGRYKVDGSGNCYWEPNDFGSDQCTPGEEGGGSVEDGTYQGSSCIGGLQNMAVASRGTFDGNELVLSVSIASALSANAAGAVHDAVADWNSKKATTKVRLNITGATSGGDIHFWRMDTYNGGPAGTAKYRGGCGDGGPVGGGPSITKNVSDNNSRAAIAPLWKHEVGHVFGLANSGVGGPGIMAELSINDSEEDCAAIIGDRFNHSATTDKVEDVDVQKAVDCLSQMWAGRTFSTYVNQQFEKQIPPEKGGGYCYETWYTQVTYSCSKVNGVSIGCGVTGTYLVHLVSSNCPPGV